MDKGSLIKDFSNLLESSQDFDIKIKVGEEPNSKEFKAHAIILSARSDYFKTALSSRWVKKENEVIIFNKPNISPTVFEILINYIYTGVFSDNNNVDLLDIFIAADEIQLNEIKQKVEKRLLETESAWKFPRDFITICKHNTFTDLYQTALELVCRNPKVIFDSNDFSKIEEDDLIKLLKSDRLRLEEIEIWEYLIKWGIENTESILDDDLTEWTQTDFIELEKVLHNCIPHIRFFQLSFDELRLITTKYKNILPDDLIEKSFQYLSDPKPKCNLPKRELAYSFDSNIIEAKDAALIASWIDKKQGMPYLSGVSSQKEAITWGTAKGPCFGFKDLWIEDNSYNSQSSVIGTSKKHSYEIGIIDNETFGIEEYEVFQIIHKKFSFNLAFN
ncbi:19657_t:CDS:2, partial [Racocetra persica]